MNSRGGTGEVLEVLDCGKSLIFHNSTLSTARKSGETSPENLSYR